MNHPIEVERPKAFVSHSGKDKKRFVLEFAVKLRGKGIDAWVDKWELLKGDSLIDKIFETGIKECKAFIIVLSNNSIDSNWVRQELNIAAVRRIENQTRILPVIIDDVEIPVVLQDTVWTRINDLNSYEKELKEIVDSILRVKEKPPIGNLPKYAVEMASFGELTRIDSLVLKVITEYVLNENIINQRAFGTDILDACNKLDISEEDLENSLEILDSDGYIKMTLTTGGWIGSSFKLNDTTIIEYAENYVVDFESIFKSIVSFVLNEKIYNSIDLAKKSGLHHIIVCSILSEWGVYDHIKYTFRMGERIQFQEISATGKRYFTETLNDI